VHIRPSVTFAELVEAYQQADLFVFPSVVEGFGQVLLEALACGLPILSTTHTAAPDLIEEGIQGFVVEPRRPDLLAQRIEWALQHPTQLAEMRVAARERAQQLTCARFRAGVVAAVAGFLARREQREEVVGQYV
jgi:glycosyltransferase involved in cell wall biosynthesis